MSSSKLLSLIIACLTVCGTVQGILVPVQKGTCESIFDSGKCRKYETVWTYNAAVGGCTKAVYGGCGGNTNRFPTKELCGILCFPENICNLPFDAGKCRGSFEVWTHNSSAGVCEKVIYGGCGGNSNIFNTERKCTAYCRPDCETAICKLNFEPGPCGADIPVWTFNSTKGACEKAVFGGCRGNDNKFKTKNECVNRCDPKESVSDDCEFDFDRGNCKAYMPVWAFNSTTGVCEKEIYGGCGGNENKFKTKNECLNRCDPKDICQFEFESGNCKAKTSVWAFNSTTGVCEKEIYGGCGGNLNKFNTKRECNQRCLLTDVPV